MVKLEDKTYLRIAEMAQLLTVKLSHFGIVNKQPARIGSIQRANNIQQRTLARTRCAHNGHNFALLYFEVYTFKDVQFIVLFLNIERFKHTQM